MGSSTITCPRCKKTLPDDFFNQPGLGPCPHCGAAVLAAVFPARWRGSKKGKEAENLVLHEHASCFYHPDHKAVIVCESCGRFLCNLCDVEFDGRHLCPGCIESGFKKSRFKSLDNQRFLYDNLALTLALLPVLMWPFTLITAPASVFVAIYFWKAPGSIIPRTRVRMILALTLGGLQTLGWCALFYKWIT
jgi:hypothetical protein